MTKSKKQEKHDKGRPLSAREREALADRATLLNRDEGDRRRAAAEYDRRYGN